jgi:hypothetical protein
MKYKKTSIIRNSSIFRLFYNRQQGAWDVSGKQSVQYFTEELPYENHHSTATALRQTVYNHFSKWNKGGIWEKCLVRLTVYHRKKLNAQAIPVTALLMRKAQSIKTQYASEECGIDGGKKVKGHKRHIVVDNLGNLLYVKVHAANLSDTKSACKVLEVLSINILHLHSKLSQAMQIIAVQRLASLLKNWI